MIKKHRKRIISHQFNPIKIDENEDLITLERKIVKTIYQYGFYDIFKITNQSEGMIITMVIFIIVFILGISSILVKPSFVEEIGVQRSTETLHLSLSSLSYILTSIILFVTNVLMIIDSLNLYHIISDQNKASIAFSILILLVLNVANALSIASDKTLDRFKDKQLQILFKTITYIIIFNVSLVFTNLIINAIIFI